MAISSTPTENITLAVGKIVFCCQQVERHFKFILPFANADDPNLSSIIARHQKLTKKPMGELAGQFILAASGDTTDLEAFVKSIVDKRNTVVHHFFDVHGENISKGQFDTVLADLSALHEEALSLLKMLQGVSLAIFELMRESKIGDIEHQNEFTQLCEQARANFAI